jgi:hypothetical protein
MYHEFVVIPCNLLICCHYLLVQQLLKAQIKLKWLGGREENWHALYERQIQFIPVTVSVGVLY